MEINRSQLIEKIVEKLTKNMTYQELLDNYKEDLADSLEENSDEELIEMVTFQIAVENKEIAELSEKDIILMHKNLAETILDSSTKEEMEERIKLISPKMSLNNSKKTFEELKIMAKDGLNDANEKLNKIKGENNGNN